MPAQTFEQSPRADHALGALILLPADRDVVYVNGMVAAQATIGHEQKKPAPGWRPGGAPGMDE